MRVGQFCTPRSRVSVLTPNATIRDAAALLMEKGFSSVVILSSDAKDRLENCPPIGIVTKTDIVRAVANATPLHTPLAEIMTSHPLTISVDAERDAAAEVLRQRKKHHLLVVDNHGSFVGLLSSWDLVREMSQDTRTYPWARDLFTHDSYVL
eukprot:gnl/Spiro4/24827_TR12342_c0_g1_i1.p2 gnl/Spiro4/24827_TR12342_c0_g1~~gnl/Spiro4/24827_TR12342_c0_g1_i1.p2  ORF type:complete len:152 (-),score=37.47 gnl/Spiro4/24827_TR12342_c0_g1_i1:65-520(-)